MADKFSRLLEKLVIAKMTHADNALKCPKRGRSFDYGKAAGIYQGFCLAEQMMNDILKEDDNDKRSF